MKLKLTILFLIISMGCNAQYTYFNKRYNPYGTYLIPISVKAVDGGYVTTGVGTDTVTYSQGAMFSRFDSVGNHLFSKCYSKPGYSYWAGYNGSLKKSPNGGFLLFGGVEKINSDTVPAVLYRFNENGDTLWTKKYHSTYLVGSTKSLIGINMTITTTNDYLLLSSVYLPGYYNGGIQLIKTDSLGNELWRKTHSVSNRIDNPESIAQTPDSGFVIGGYSYVATSDFDGDAVLYKVDKNGNYQWKRYYGSQWMDGPAYVISAQDSTIVFVYSETYKLYQAGTPESELPEIAIVKIDMSGNLIWKRNYRIYHTIYVQGLLEDDDGNYITYGVCHYKDTLTGDYGIFAPLLKVSQNGDTLWWRNHENIPFNSIDYYNTIYDVDITPDNGLIACGQTSSYNIPQSAWLLKTDSVGCDYPGCGWTMVETATDDVGEIMIYPNPSSDKVYLTINDKTPIRSIEVFNVIGECVTRANSPFPNEQVELNISSFNNGLYIVKCSFDNNQTVSLSFIKN